MPDSAEYRYEVITVANRSTDGRPVYRRTGWSVVKYANTPESYEPLDGIPQDGRTDKGEKEINGFVVANQGYPFSEVTGGDVAGSLPPS
jgi:hypothetical protein